MEDEMNPEHKVGSDVAEQEFERFLDAMDLVEDRDLLEGEDRKEFAEAKSRLMRAIQGGNLIVDEKGQPVYSPKMGNQDPITFFEPKGKTLMAGDGIKEGRDRKKMHAIMAAITRENPVRFENMMNRDLKICQAIATLFLAG